MRIGELARRTGVSVRALRFYEERGVLQPRRTANGYREFDPAAVQTVGHVQLLLSAGLRLELIGQILACLDGPELLLADCRDRLLVERRRMAAQQASLAAAQEILDGLLA
ncbi:MerR family transcriptional regulator [Pseudonocardia sp. CA-107938]|uniref:MerR family transcriptional regulator n=1 Tax=Pseudonocardia sp. CA-107938 TaxID=3240021 RepID=UPI003D91E37E